MDTMDADDNEVKVTLPASRGEPTQKKLYPVAKMAAGRKSGLKSKKDNIVDNRLRSRLHLQPTSSSSSSKRVPEWIVKYFLGTCAPYNDHANWVHDPSDHKVYMIGGIRPSDTESWEPTSDFFCYDTRSMKWENLTDALIFREPYDPYSSNEMRRRTKPLPVRGQPGCTLWRLEDTSFIFMFGGYDLETKSPSSQVVMINLETREWWYEKINGNPTPRIAPAVVAIQNSVYVFGGYKSYKRDPLACYSYSIAEWKPASSGSRWSWTYSDVAYSTPLPQTSCIGQAISVYGGKLIFLAPGRTNEFDDRLLEFTDQNLFYFRPAEHVFQRVPILGDPPRNIEWYSIFDLQSTPAYGPITLFSNSSTSAPEGRRTRGRPRKYAPVPQPITSQPPATPIPPSIAICAWINLPPTAGSETEEEEPYYPGIYRFTFHPDDICASLNVMEKISSLKRDFQGCSFTNGRLRLLGNHPTTRSDPTADKTWNIYLDVPFNA